MKRTVITIVCFFAAFLLTYLACAFVAWQPDPSQWKETGRGSYIATSFIVGVFFTIVASLE